MDFDSLLTTLIIGGIAGWLAAAVMKIKGNGLVGNIVLGIIGALVGNWLLGKFGVHIATGLVGAVINAFLGAIVVLSIFSMAKK
jgi:uncharacterized membrane protein YeaQ/YmgE (transglycosylase-associated protein family)